MIRGTDYAYLTAPIGGKGLVAIFDVHAKTKIFPKKLGNGYYIFQINTKAIGLLRETYPKNIPITPKEKRWYEQRMGRYVRLRMERLLVKLRSLKSDPIGFGRKLRARYPQEWERMD